MREPSLTGRRDLLEETRCGLAEGPGVLLHGPAGIGKSALLAEVLASWEPTGAVLHCAPVEEDAQLPFVGLIDLFAQVPRGVFDDLSPQPRAALDAALLLGKEPVGGPDRLAVRIAVLEVLRVLAAEGPVLIAVDDLQWLDGPSADVLAFAVRRLEGLDVRMVAAERVAVGEEPERLRCCPPGTVELVVPPLADVDTARLVGGVVGTNLPRPVLRSIQRTAAGNPLYALELARAVLRRGPAPEPERPFPVPRRLRTLLLDRARTLPAAARRTLLVASAAARPSLALLRRAGLADPAADLETASRLGMARVDAGGAVRFHHPLIRAAVYADAAERDRRHAHALLAAAVAEPVERARHLALAHPYEDAETADTLMAAADSARSRGALGTAAELAALAARRTPADRPGQRTDRLLAAAEYACDGGRIEEAGRAAEAVLAESDSARQRVRARLVLLRNAGQALEAAGELIEDGLRDAGGDPQLESWLCYWASGRCLLRGELEESARLAGYAAERAAAAGDTGARILALASVARARSLAGETAAAERALDEALTDVGGAGGGPEGWRLVRMRAVLALDSDRVAAAHQQVSELLRRMGESAGVEEVIATLVALVRIQVRYGHVEDALVTAERCARTGEEAGVAAAPALYAAALAATAGGEVDEARSLAARAVKASEADGDRLFLLRALAVLGEAELLGGDVRGAAAAAEALGRAKELGEAMCAADPPLLRWYADLAEALAMLGETDAAEAVVRDAYARLPADPPVSVRAALHRAEGLREAALGRAKEGAELLRTAAELLRPLPLPVELVRTLIALGTVERRTRRRGAARVALDEALETAEAIGARPLAARAGEELGRLHAAERRPAGDDRSGRGPVLTPSEARVARLAVGGATNREVAAELFISVKTVEGTLSRVFRKFGVRSRTALAHAMSTAEPSGGPAAEARDRNA